MRFFVAIACSLLIAGGFVQVAAAAAPVAERVPMDVQIWPATIADQSIVVVGVTVPESVPLPATVRIPIPPGMEIIWAGEIMGADSGADIQHTPAIKKGTGGTFAEFEITESRSAQVEAGPLKAGGSKLAFTWVQSAPASVTAFALRLPAGELAKRVNPSPVGAPRTNSQGESLYTLPSMKLDLGDKEVITATWGSATEDLEPSNGDSTWIVIGVLAALVVAALVALVVATRRQSRRRHSSASEAEDTKEPFSD